MFDFPSHYLDKLSGQEQISSKQLSPLSPQSEFEDVIDDHESDLSLSDAPLKCPATFTDEEVKTTGTAIPIMSTERVIIFYIHFFTMKMEHQQSYKVK